MTELVMEQERQQFIQATEHQKCSTLEFLKCLESYGKQGEKKLELLIREIGDDGKRNIGGIHCRNNR